MAAIAFNLYRPENTCCIVVGLGLIGRSIANYLAFYGEEVQCEKGGFSWDDPGEIINYINLLLRNSGRDRFELIWCGGRAGFSALDSEMRKEYEVFSRVINTLSASYKENITLNFISSAGGLYEGNEIIDKIEDVNPVRPYGIWKLKQEDLILMQNISARIYRVSSAYGFSFGLTRFGLIDSLIKSSFTRNSLQIYANPSTLRDYVFTKDIARLVVEDIISGRQDVIRVVASGRAVSVDMIINLISQLLKKQVRVTYAVNEANNRDIVFPAKLSSSE